MGNTFKKKRKHPLEHLTRPTGLYSECPWQQDAVERGIYNGDFAPICPGSEDESPKRTECPICFLFFPQFLLNATCCCDHKVCTECLLQVTSPTSPSICPFCNNENLTCKLMVNAIEEPERFGLGAEQFEAYLRQIQKNKEVQNTGKKDGGDTQSVIVATYKERLGHEAVMSKLNHQAELERHTSPTLQAFSNSGGSSGRMASYSLDGGRRYSPNRRSRRRRASGSRASQSGRSNASLAQRELIQNAFGIPSELTSLMSQQNMDEILLAEAMRRSMSMDQQVPQEDQGGKGSTTESNANKSLLDHARGNNDDDMLAAAIALSLQEQKNRNAESSTSQGNDGKDTATLGSQPSKESLKKSTPSVGSPSLDPASDKKKPPLDSEVGTTVEATVRSDAVEEEALRHAIEQSKLAENTKVTTTEACNDKKLVPKMSEEEDSVGGEDGTCTTPASEVDPENTASNNETSKLKVESPKELNIVAEVQTQLNDLIDTIVPSEEDAKPPAGSNV